MHTGQQDPLYLPQGDQYVRFSTQFISGKLRILGYMNSFFLL